MTMYIVRFGLSRTVEADSVDAVKKWAHYTLESLQRHVPDTDPYMQSHVRTTIGTDHAEVNAQIPDAQADDPRWTPAGFVFLEEAT